MSSFRRLSVNNKLTILSSIIILVLTIIISNSVQDIRDTRSKAATTTVWLNPTNRVTGTRASPNFLSFGCDMSSVNTCVDEGAPADGDASFIYTDNTGDIGPISFDFENPDLTGKIIDSVSVQVVARNTVGQNNSAVIAFLTTNNETEKKFKNVPATCPIGGDNANQGTTFEWMSCYTDTSYRTYSWRFDTNFNYGAWTASDLTNIKVGVQAWPNVAGTQTRITMIRVYAQLTDAPSPPPPAPTLNFSATSTSIAYNSSTTLNWSSTNATSCTASGAWSGSKGTSGSQSTGNLTSSKTYSLSCTGSGGTSPTVSVTVNVGSPPPSPPPPSPSPPPPSPSPPPPSPPPPSGGGSSGGGSSSSKNNGSSNLPKLEPPKEDKPLAGYLNFLKLKILTPYLSSKLKTNVVVGSFSKEIEIGKGSNEVTVDTRGALFPLGTALNLVVGENRFLIKKLVFNPISLEVILDVGELAVGDLNGDNKINDIDRKIMAESIFRSKQGDVNNDGITNALDWSIQRRYLGKVGD